MWNLRSLAESALNGNRYSGSTQPPPSPQVAARGEARAEDGFGVLQFMKASDFTSPLTIDGGKDETCPLSTGGGRDVSPWYGGKDETCPLSTGGGGGVAR